MLSARAHGVTRLARPMPAGVLAAVVLAENAYDMLQGPESSQIAHSAHLGGALLGAV